MLLLAFSRLGLGRRAPGRGAEPSPALLPSAARRARYHAPPSSGGNPEH